MKRADVVFWAAIIVVLAGFALMFVDGIMHAEAMEPEAPQEIACDSEPSNVETITVDEFMSRAREAWERVTAAPEEEPEEEQEEEEEEYVEEYYYEPVYYYGGYAGGSTATDLHDLTNGQGRAYDDNGTSYTYYYDVCGDLDIPGEHKDADGVSYDGDGYIVVASDMHSYGDIIETPYGEARCYDHGAGYGTIDIYVG